MTTTTLLLFCFLALVSTVYGCAPLIPGVGNPANPATTVIPPTNNDERIAKLTAEIEELQKSVETDEKNAETKEAELSELEERSRYANKELPRAKSNAGGFPAAIAARKVARFEKTVKTFEDAKAEAEKAKKGVSEKKRKLEELMAEKKVLQYGKLTADAFDEKIKQVEKSLSDSKAKLVTDKEEVAAIEAQLAELEKDNAAVFDQLLGAKISYQNAEGAGIHFKLKAELDKIDKVSESAKFTAKEKEVQEARDRVFDEAMLMVTREDLVESAKTSTKEFLDKKTAQLKDLIDYREEGKKALQEAKELVEQTELTIHSLEFEKKTLEQEKAGGK